MNIEYRYKYLFLLGLHNKYSMSELKKVKGTFLEMFSEIGYNTGKQLWEKLETSQDLDGFIDDLSLEVNKKNLDISFIGSFLEFAC